MFLFWKKIRKLENLHVLVWILKDYSWMLKFKLLGSLMILPAIAISGFIAWELRNDEDLTPCLAVLMLDNGKFLLDA